MPTITQKGTGRVIVRDNRKVIHRCATWREAVAFIESLAPRVWIARNAV